MDFSMNWRVYRLTAISSKCVPTLLCAQQDGACPSPRFLHLHLVPRHRLNDLTFDLGEEAWLGPLAGLANVVALLGLHDHQEMCPRWVLEHLTHPVVLTLDLILCEGAEKGGVASASIKLITHFVIR